ncbi:MAG: hypothetical protein ACREMB_03090 [Candidatus Rokuibacteriota bacterium]
MDAKTTEPTKRELFKGVVAAMAAGAALGGCMTARAQTAPRAPTGTKAPFFTVTFAEDGEILQVARIDRKPVEDWKLLDKAPVDGVVAVNQVLIVTANSTYIYQGGRRICL